MQRGQLFPLCRKLTCSTYARTCCDIITSIKGVMWSYGSPIDREDYIMLKATKDQKKVLKALGVYKNAKLKSDNGHTKFVSPQISVPINLPRNIKNPKVYVKQYEKMKLA